MNIGIIVEGPSDKDVVEVLLSKRGVRAIIRLMRGNNPAKARGHVNTLLERGFKKVIVLKDLHGLPARVEKMKEELRSRISTGGVKIIVVKQSIEAWLLGDPKAVKRVLGHAVHVANPEEVPKPDEELDKAAMRCGKRYIKGLTTRRLAEEMDVDRAAEKCPSLKEFLEELKN